jgi:AraC family transcriptional regulator, regulatory protein of adaptative response / methylphosphotriester-DNA alkyltransferase methyltransferase
MKAAVTYSPRQKEIVDTYAAELDKHLAAIKSGEADEMLEIGDFARIMHIHPTHLSNTIHEVLGVSACSIFEHKILTMAKDMLLNTNLSIAQIARQLTYDPSNFTKFFKNYEGMTPKQFRSLHMEKI